MSDGIGLEGDKHPYYDFKEDGYDFKGVSFLDLLDMIPVIGTAVRCTGAVIDPNSDEMSAQCALNAAFDGATFASGGLDLPAVEAAKVAAKAAEKIAAREAVEAAERAIEKDIERVAENAVEREGEVLRTAVREGEDATEKEAARKAGQRRIDDNIRRGREARKAEKSAKKEAEKAATEAAEKRMTKATLRRMNLQELYNFAKDISECEETFVDIIAAKVGELSGDNTEAYVKLHDLNPVCWNQDPIAPPGPEDRKDPQGNPDAHPLIFVPGNSEFKNSKGKQYQDPFAYEVLGLVVIAGILLYAYSKSK